MSTHLIEEENWSTATNHVRSIEQALINYKTVTAYREAAMRTFPEHVDQTALHRDANILLKDIPYFANRLMKVKEEVSGREGTVTTEARMSYLLAMTELCEIHEDLFQLAEPSFRSIADNVGRAAAKLQAIEDQQNGTSNGVLH